MIRLQMFLTATVLNQEETADLVTFTEEILNGKLHFLCSDKGGKWKA